MGILDMAAGCEQNVLGGEQNSTKNDVSQKFIKHTNDRKSPRRVWLAIMKLIS
jgi:hypothetical protein